MRFIAEKEANFYLHSIGMQLNSWNKIICNKDQKNNWINFRAPKNELLNFSQHVAGWLSRGEWKIFQIDNSTGWMDPVQFSLFSGLLCGSENLDCFNQFKDKSLFFKFGKDNSSDDNTELLISNLIYIFLLFESHAYIVSSNCANGQILGIQDGFVYFLSNEENIIETKGLLEKFKLNPIPRPEWVNKIFVERQNQLIQ